MISSVTLCRRFSVPELPSPYKTLLQTGLALCGLQVRRTGTLLVLIRMPIFPREAINNTIVFDFHPEKLGAFPYNPVSHTFLRELRVNIWGTYRRMTLIFNILKNSFKNLFMFYICYNEKPF